MRYAGWSTGLGRFRVKFMLGYGLGENVGCGLGRGQDHGSVRCCATSRPVFALGPVST